MQGQGGLMRESHFRNARFGRGWRAGLLLAVVGSVMCASAAPASATTYCVAPATGCGGGDLSTLAAALTAAHGNAGADDVRLGAMTYTDGPWSYSDGTGTNPVTIRGAGTGASDSQLFSSAGGPTLTLGNGNADNIAVFTPTAGGVALNISGGTLSNSRVLVASNSRGVDASGATIDHDAISPSSGSASNNTAVLADNSNVLDTQMSTTNGVEVSNGPVAV